MNGQRTDLGKQQPVELGSTAQEKIYLHIEGHHLSTMHPTKKWIVVG